MQTFTAFGMFQKGPFTTNVKGLLVPAIRIPYQILLEHNDQIEAGKQVVYGGFIDPQEKEEFNTASPELQYQFQEVQKGLVIINNDDDQTLRVRGYLAGEGLVETAADHAVTDTTVPVGKALVFDGTNDVSRVVVGY